MILSVAVIFILLLGIEELTAQMEEYFSIFIMQGFCNKIYKNANKIIGWDPKEVNQIVIRERYVMADASDVGTEGGSMLEG